MADRRRRIHRFVRIVLGVTVAAHMTFALAVRYAALRLGFTHPSLLAALTTLSLLALFPRRLSQLLPDRRHSPLRLHLIEEPYFAHWCAAIGSAPLIAAASVASLVAAAVRGAPFEVPGASALGFYAVMLVLSVWGVFFRRRWVRIREIEIPIRDLGSDLDGYRIVQLSDLHIGGFTPASWLERWVETANRSRPDLVVVTGDLITNGNDFHAEVAEQVGKLTALDGVCVVMGNHDYFGDGEALVASLRRHGARVLRNEGMLVTRGRAHLRVLGIDDLWSDRADVRRTLGTPRTKTPTILLAHDPAFFEPASDFGVDLVLSGHTHGGQVAMPFFARALNLSKLAHRHHVGLYGEESSMLYVHPGLGTTGPPIRIGSAPEITIFTLRRKSMTPRVEARERRPCDSATVLRPSDASPTSRDSEELADHASRSSRV